MNPSNPFFTTLITAGELLALRAGGRPVAIFDVSFDLMQPGAGEQQYRQAHIPGAQYAHLDRDLSAKGAPDAASGGRHPLPARAQVARWLAARGVSQGTQVVVYDRQGCNFCGRLWWMARWAGHAAVAVLDGGLPAWQAAGGPVAQGEEAAPAPGDFRLADPLERLVTADALASRLGEPGLTIVDARAAPRYRGEVEPLDPVAGHIPGALNRPFGENVTADGRFKPASQLRAEWQALLAGRDAAGVVHQCGSGVSAVPNLLALRLAGLGDSALFAGSWSEWCADPARPVARGAG